MADIKGMSGMVNLKISGMNCQHCVRAVTEALREVPGVESVDVDLDAGLARVEGSAGAERLIEAVSAAGYQAESV